MTDAPAPEPVPSSSPDRLVDYVRNGAGMLDGIMSPQTVRLMAAFGATRVDMTELWASVPQAWVCPGCGRAKPGLVRLNVHRELMCRLVEHHDHMGDALDERFRFHSTTRDAVVADDLAKAFVKRSASMFSAYDRTVVCNDCNNADPQAKAAIGAPGPFSFSPAEIRQFVRPRPNEPHLIDVATAAKLFEQARPTFDIRMRFINGIARIAASDTHWFQATQRSARLADVRVAARWLAQARGHLGSLDVLCGERRAANHSITNWRTRTHPCTRRAPTRGEVEHVAHVESRENWQAVADDWECPGCGRGKVDVVRLTSKSKHYRFTAQRRSFMPEAADPTPRPTVCGDCWETGISLGKEACEVAGAVRGEYLSLVQLSEVRAIVRPQPHGRHNIDPVAARRVIGAVARRIEAEDATAFDIKWD